MLRDLLLCALVVSTGMLTLLAKPQGGNLAANDAPTVEQCRADGTAWEKINLAANDANQEIARAHLGDSLSKFEGAAHYWKRFSFSEISRRSYEMCECAKLDTQNEKKYLFDAVYLEGEANNRYMNFLNRHSLWNEFVAEDAQGKR